MHYGIRLAAFSILGLLVLSSGGSVLSLAPAQGVPMVRVHVSNSSVASSNWGGYAVTGASGSVNAVSASWTVPTVTCGSSETSYSAYWVGIDGFSSSTVEQTGTDSDCHNGVPTYYAWYEFYPKASQGIGSIVVSPGDEIGAAVVYSPKTGLFYAAIRDFTTGAQFATKSAVSGAQRSSAEWIVEAPSICFLIRCRLTTLSNFGTVGFGQDQTGLTVKINCAANIGGVTGPIGAFGSAVQQITMVSQSNPSVVKAQPSALSVDGTSFTATWMSPGP